MNTLVIVLIAAVCLLAGYALYGRWLAKKWGIDPTAETPAVKHNDGEDYVLTNGWTVFAHQFSSIAGAGPVTGAIQAAAFGWLPVLLWILLGGIFFGAVTDFGALYASVKNEGKSMGLLIEKYIGKTGRRLFLGFCWLFTLIVIAAFADMVAGTFNAYVETDGVVSLADSANANGASRMYLTALHRICSSIWSDPEEIQFQGLETGSRRTGIHSSRSADRYEPSYHCYQRYLVIHHICLYLPGSRTSNVASDGTKRLHDHIHVRRYDHRCCAWSRCSTSIHEPPCIHRLQ